jgi:general secretion pathway protein G
MIATTPPVTPVADRSGALHKLNAGRLQIDHVFRACTGFTLLELMFVVALVGILTMLAVGQFSGYIERTKVATARADIMVISVEIQRFQNMHDGKFPATLADIGRTQFLDPWERPYHYVDLTGKSRGKARKDKRLNPLNSDYDLFSAGRNGIFKSQISQKDSLDDVIRARDGAFVDLASKF